MKRIISILLFLLPFLICSQEAWPVIDMHLHAMDGGKSKPIAPMVGYVAPGGSVVALMEETLKALDSNNVVLAVTSGSELNMYKEKAPQLIVKGLGFQDVNSVDSLEYRIKSEDIKVLSESYSQYYGFRPDDPELEPYFKLAEDLGIPVGYHVGLGTRDAPFSRTKKDYRIGNGNPVQLEEMLAKHKDLRIYICHAGWPFLDEMIAMMWGFRELYVDVSVINWMLPEEEFYHYLKRMVQAGFGNRIMFGSDQMLWPQGITEGIRRIKEAPFLTNDQKKAILYDNAARFLRLSEEEIERHHQIVNETR